MVDPPSAFIAHWARALLPSIPQPRRALDVAMGRGRHAVLLAREGFRVSGVDIDPRAVADARIAASREGHDVIGWSADLTTYPLPRARFELVVVTRYLQRTLFAALRELPVPGGIVLYETFTLSQRIHGSGPTSADHLLKPGELAGLFRGLEILFYEEVAAPAAVARLVARRR